MNSANHQQTNREKLLTEAYQLQQTGHLREAIKLCEQLRQLNSKDSDAIHLNALIHAQQDNMLQAIDLFKQAIAINPAQPGLHNNLANAYKKIKQPQLAIKHYQQAITLQPDYAQAHHNLAGLYAQKNEHDKALAHYRQAVHAAPDFTAAHFDLGLLLIRINQFTAAHKQFTNVLALNPDWPDAYFYLGLLDLKEGQLDAALHAFQQTVKLNSNHVQALTNLGVIVLKQQQPQLAIDYFAKALAIDNNHIEARNNLAATFIHHDRFENALTHYQVLLQQDPDNIEYLYNSGVAEMSLGSHEKAIALFEKLLSKEPEHPAALSNLAAIYMRLNDKPKATTLLQQVVSLNPTDKVSLHMLNALTADKEESATCPEYAANLFNNYAINFDKHLLTQLDYQLPNHLWKIIDNLPQHYFNHVLDLGCGTGLAGQVLRNFSQRLDGVDIAEKMLAQAKEKRIYDNLFTEEVLSFLQTTSARYDLITALDVFPYFGALEDLFSQIVLRLNNQGYFIFTTEISADKPWKLQETARFCHHLTYLKQLLTSFQLQLIDHQQVIARQQANENLLVHLIVCRKA